MAKKSVHEHFESGSEPSVTASPALANLLATHALVEKKQMDTLARDHEVVPEHPYPCPKQKECPDMSQYIRLDEIPCWNCSLP